MHYINRSIVKHLQSRQYFVDAMNWYERKYIYPSTERAVLIILTCIFLLAALIISKFTKDIFPLTKEISVPILMTNIDEQVPIIIKVSHKGESVNYALAKYLLSNYVIRKESYDYNQLAKQLEFIRNNSFRQIYEQFVNEMDFANPNSTVYKYQANFTRSIEIKNITKTNKNNTIHITFLAKVMDLNQKVTETSLWLAKIAFIMNDIEKNNKNLNFIISDYKVEKITSEPIV